MASISPMRWGLIASGRGGGAGSDCGAIVGKANGEHRRGALMRQILERELHAQAEDSRRNDRGRSQKSLVGDLLAADCDRLRSGEVVLILVGVTISDVERVKEKSNFIPFTDPEALLHASVQARDIGLPLSADRIE